MYTKYFNLKEKPFQLTPDPKYLYLSRNHNKAVTALAELVYAAKENIGFAVVIGEVGTGKTTICRAFANRINRLKENYQLAYLINPDLDELGLYQTINRELGIKCSSESKMRLHNLLVNHLIEQNKAGRSVILLIDEAQNLSPSVLEQVRLLSNLETETQKLIQIILVGQPELSSLLQSASLRQLNQRISVRCFLFPLKFKEMTGYIRHRLRIAGGEHLIGIFTYPSFLYIYLFSRGIPRLVNIVCDRALLAAYSTDLFRINLRMVRRCVNETAGSYLASWFSRKIGSFLILAYALFSAGYSLV